MKHFNILACYQSFVNLRLFYKSLRIHKKKFKTPKRKLVKIERTTKEKFILPLEKTDNKINNSRSISTQKIKSISSL